MEGILKLAKLSSRKVTLEEFLPTPSTSCSSTRPGLREDNTFLQYRESMTGGELEAYWARPFTVKSYLGYHGWPSAGQVRLCHTAKDFLHIPESVLGVIAEFFLDESKTARWEGLLTVLSDLQPLGSWS